MYRRSVRCRVKAHRWRNFPRGLYTIFRDRTNHGFGHDRFALVIKLELSLVINILNLDWSDRLAEEVERRGVLLVNSVQGFHF